MRRVILDVSSDDVVYSLADNEEYDKDQPDLMIGTEVKNKDHYFFFVEIKDASRSRYQVEDNSVKLMKLMKNSIDDQLRLGIENPSSLGLLVQDLKYTLFFAKLLVNGVYAPIAVKRFSVVEGVNDMIHLPAVVEVLHFVKTELYTFIEEPALTEKEKTKSDQNIN